MTAGTADASSWIPRTSRSQIQIELRDAVAGLPSCNEGKDPPGGVPAIPWAIFKGDGDDAERRVVPPTRSGSAPVAGVEVVEVVEPAVGARDRGSEYRTSRSSSGRRASPTRRS